MLKSDKCAVKVKQQTALWCHVLTGTHLHIRALCQRIKENISDTVSNYTETGRSTGNHQYRILRELLHIESTSNSSHRCIHLHTQTYFPHIKTGYERLSVRGLTLATIALHPLHNFIPDYAHFKRKRHQMKLSYTCVRERVCLCVFWSLVASHYCNYC